MRARLYLPRLGRLFPPRPARQDPPRGAVRGVMRSVISVKPADPRFREALFILRDDYFLDPDRTQEELLREAREAAFSCAETAPPRRPRRFPFWLVPVLALLAAATCRCAGVI